MADNKKYYWLKLKRDFFKRHDIRIIEEMPNGKDYVFFYLKMLLESVDHEGSLRFSDTIPYNEQMLSVVTNTNIDIVRSAMKLFIGSETAWAEKKRLQRAKGDNVPQLSSKCPTEIEKEEETESEKESHSFILSREEEKQKILGGSLGGGVVMLSDEQFNSLCDQLSFEELNKYIAIVRDMELSGKKYKKKTHYQAILDMALKDRKVGKETT